MDTSELLNARAYLVEHGLVVLAVELGVAYLNALAGGELIQLGLDGKAYLVKRGVVHLLDYGYAVALGAGAAVVGGLAGFFGGGGVRGRGSRCGGGAV